MRGLGTGRTQFREEAREREQSHSGEREEAERETSSREQISERREAQNLGVAETSVASESREEKMRLERVRERGTVRRKKAPILLERVTLGLSEVEPSQRGEGGEREQSRGLE